MVIIHQFVPTKNETDKNFNNGIDLMFNNINSVDFFIASHNEFSTIKTVELMKKHGIKEDDEKVWFGQLYGMGDNISFNLASKGFNVAKNCIKKVYLSGFTSSK